MENGGNTQNEPARFWTQANALLRKNLTYQKRNVKTTVRLILFPFAVCLLLVLIQKLLDNQLDKAKYTCGCTCENSQGDGQCVEEVCGIEYSDLDQVSTCSVPTPPEWAPLMQFPAPKYRAVRTEFLSNSDFPNASCRTGGSCPVTMFFTGNNQSLGQILSGNMIPSTLNMNNSDTVGSLASNVMGSASYTENTNFLEPAFYSDLPIYYLQSQCTQQNSTFSIPVQISTSTRQQGI